LQACWTLFQIQPDGPECPAGSICRAGSKLHDTGSRAGMNARRDLRLHLPASPCSSSASAASTNSKKSRPRRSTRPRSAAATATEDSFRGDGDWLQAVLDRHRNQPAPRVQFPSIRVGVGIMANLIQTVPLEDTAHLSPTRLGRWTGLLLSFLTAAAFGIGMMSPPRSGSFCTDPCIAYPYSDATQFVPHDFIWMAPGIPLVPLFVVLAGCIHACSENGKRHLTLICLSFVSISAAILTLDYAIAIAVVQPSLFARRNRRGGDLLPIQPARDFHCAGGIGLPCAEHWIHVCRFGFSAGSRLVGRSAVYVSRQPAAIVHKPSGPGMAVRSEPGLPLGDCGHHHQLDSVDCFRDPALDLLSSPNPQAERSLRKDRERLRRDHILHSACEAPHIKLSDLRMATHTFAASQ
jgi:hypothetical protein